MTNTAPKDVRVEGGEKLRVYPALGNHELVGDTQKCLTNWWTAFPTS